MRTTFSQCIHVTNHHNAQFKYLTILFVNYTSTQLTKKKTMEVRFKPRVLSSRSCNFNNYNIVITIVFKYSIVIIIIFNVINVKCLKQRKH